MMPLPDILLRRIVFVARETGHRWSAERIRLKLSSGTDDFAAEAERLTDAELGPKYQYQGDDEEAHDEWQMRAQFIDDFQRGLEKTEAYLWGLGIAGIYHQFERDIREVIGDFICPWPKRHALQTANFDQLCHHLETLGYQIKQSAVFEQLDTARQVSNVIKHGEGTSFGELVKKRPDLFPEYEAYSHQMRSRLRLDAGDLQVGAVEFDRTVSAISMIWPEMEKALSRAVELPLSEDHNDAKRVE